MKFVILHGTEADHTAHWFSWLATQLNELGHDTWVPDLPQADHPDIKIYNQFFLDSGYDFSDAVLIGHSSGAVAINGLLQEFDVSIDTAILVGVFKGTLGWSALSSLDIPYDYAKIAQRAKRRIVIHSDNDPHCPLEGAQWIAEQLNAQFLLWPGTGHFNTGSDPRFTEFPELLELIKKDIIS